MSYESSGDDLLKEFYDECYKLFDKQVFKLKQRKAWLCAIQVVRHLLRDIARTHGNMVALKIIKANEEAHDLRKDKPLSEPNIYDAPSTEINWFSE